MTLEEAIKSAEEVVSANERLSKKIHPAMQLFDYGKIAERHRQLAEWLKELKQLRKKTRWIPFKTRPMTEEEMTFYRDWAEYGAELFDCPLPDDGQEVLVSCGGNVCIDTFVKDDSDGCYFEGVDIDDVEAWCPLPEPYKAERRENDN